MKTKQSKLTDWKITKPQKRDIWSIKSQANTIAILPCNAIPELDVANIDFSGRS